MRIDIQAELTPELLAEAGIAYSTKDKVYGAKYRRSRDKLCLRAGVMLAIAVALLVAFFCTMRGEFLVLAVAAALFGAATLYTALAGNKKRAIQRLVQAGGETRHRRYLITDKKIESQNGEKTTLLRWTDFDRTLETPNTLILLGKRVLVLPKAALTAEQTAQLTAFLTEQYGQGKK